MDLIKKLEEIQQLLIIRYGSIPHDLNSTINDIKNWIVSKEENK